MLAKLLASVLATSALLPLKEQVKALAPHLTHQKAWEYSALIQKVANRYDLDPTLLAAIIAQESSFRNGILSCRILYRRKACWVSCDSGLTQVNDLWIRKWGLDPERLANDPVYNISVAGRILALIRRQFGHETNWWGRFHSSTPRFREAYEAKIEERLAAIF